MKILFCCICKPLWYHWYYVSDKLSTCSAEGQLNIEYIKFIVERLTFEHDHLSHWCSDLGLTMTSDSSSTLTDDESLSGGVGFDPLTLGPPSSLDASDLIRVYSLGSPHASKAAARHDCAPHTHNDGLNHFYISRYNLNVTLVSSTPHTLFCLQYS